MLGFNQTSTNRPQDPLMNLTFDEWWFVSRSSRSFKTNPTIILMHR